MPGSWMTFAPSFGVSNDTLRAPVNHGYIPAMAESAPSLTTRRPLHIECDPVEAHADVQGIQAVLDALLAYK